MLELREKERLEKEESKCPFDFKYQRWRENHLRVDIKDGDDVYHDYQESIENKWKKKG